MNQNLQSATSVAIDNFWAEEYPGLEARNKRELISRYALFLRSLASADPDQALPLPPDSCIAMTPDGAIFKCAVGAEWKRASQQQLAPLLAWFWVASSRTERFRFLRAFGGDDKPLRSWNLAVVEQAAFDSLRKIWSRKVRIARIGGVGYRVGQQSGFAVWFRDNMPTVTALNSLLPDPDQAFSGALICKAGSRNHTARVELVGDAYLLKRYNCRGLFYRLRNALRPSRAVKNWELLHHFQLRGISVPNPYLCIEERRNLLLGRSYVLMDFCLGETLRQMWPELAEQDREMLIASLSKLLGQMHRFGLLHGDLKWDNILVQRTVGSLRVKLIDFDGARLVQYPSLRRAEKDLRRFLRDLRDNDPSGHWEARFMSGWAAWLSHL